MKRNIVIATVAAAALIGGGTAVAVAGGTDSAKPASSASGKTRVTLSEAADAAVRAVPGTPAALELDHGTWHADILGEDGRWHEVTVDASSAEVLKQRVDADEDADTAALKGAKVSATEAARKAGSHATVTSVDFDDDRKAVWEVEVVKDHKERDLNVDAQSGKVTQAPSDDDHGDDHGDED